MKILTIELTLALLLASGSVAASEALAKKNNCIGCHHMTDKKVGPTWKAIADKNKGVADAEKVLTDASIKGGKDKYGKVPMPPQPKANKADASKIAKWILTL
jgi:cytochrome c